jgi:enoyl-CoA hydratase
MSKAYKQLINAGYASSFGDGMSLEAKISREANAQVEAGDVEARRKAVMERGRGQS